MTTRNIFTAAILLTTFLLPAVAYAQALDGCVNSPENSTAILAAVGALSGTVAMLRRRR